MQRSLVIVSHKFLTQPDDDLVIYINNKKYTNVLHICHSFSDAPDRRSWYIWYKNGEIFKHKKSKDYKLWPEPLIYFKEGYFTIKWVLATRMKWEMYIGMDGLCVLWGNVLRSVGIVKRTVYWAIDFVPKNRFKEQIKNAIYHFINVQGYKNSDEMWDLSPRMAEARKKFLGISAKTYKKRRVVPYGTWTKRIKKYTYEECDKNVLVFMGHLLEKQGAQLVIAAMPQILKRNPHFRFKIIGTGNYKEQLEVQAKDLNLLKFCDFKGKIEDHRDLENEIATSAVAIAPYIKRLDTWTYYADPGKVKTYLACGVPVLLTDLPWNAVDIEKQKCGMIITEDAKDIIQKILRLMDKKINNIYRKNAIAFSQTYDYNTIFSSLGL